MRGDWALDYQGATAQVPTRRIALNYHAKDVYIVAGGEGDFKGFPQWQDIHGAHQRSSDTSPDRR